MDRPLPVPPSGSTPPGQPKPYKTTKQGFIKGSDGKKYQILWHSHQNTPVKLPNNPLIASLFLDTLFKIDPKLKNISGLSLSKDGLKEHGETKKLTPQAQKDLIQIQNFANVLISHTPGMELIESDPIFEVVDITTLPPNQEYENENAVSKSTLPKDPLQLKKEVNALYTLTSDEQVTELDTVLKNETFNKELSQFLVVRNNLLQQLVTDVSKSPVLLSQLQTHCLNLQKLFYEMNVSNKSWLNEFVFENTQSIKEIAESLLVTQQLMGSNTIHPLHMRILLDCMIYSPGFLKNFKQFLLACTDAQKSTLDMLIKDKPYNSEMITLYKQIFDLYLLFMPPVMDFKDKYTTEACTKVLTLLSTLCEKSVINNSQINTDTFQQAYRQSAVTFMEKRAKSNRDNLLKQLEQKSLSRELSSLVRMGYHSLHFYNLFGKAEWLFNDPVDTKGTTVFTKAVRLLSYALPGQDVRFAFIPLDLTLLRVKDEKAFVIAINFILEYISKENEDSALEWDAKTWLSNALKEAHLPLNTFSSVQIGQMKSISAKFFHSSTLALSKMLLSVGHEGIQFPGVHSLKPATGDLKKDKELIADDLKNVYQLNDAEIKKVVDALTNPERAQLFKELIDACHIAMVVGRYNINPRDMHILNIESAYHKLIMHLSQKSIYEKYVSDSSVNILIEAANRLIPKVFLS